MPTIETYVGNVIDEPIRNGLVTEANLRTMWDAPVKLRDKNQVRLLSGGGSMTYTYLRYIPGLVTYCSLGAAPVFTGYMSGCFLFRFRMGGKQYAAHVGTDDTNEEKNDKVKRVWRTFADSAAVSDVMGYNPTRDLSGLLMARINGVGRAMQFAGWWETNGAMRTVVLAGIHGQDTKKEIFAADYAALRPWAAIRTHPKFSAT